MQTRAKKIDKRMLRTVDKDNVRLDVFVSTEWGVSRSNAKTVIERDGAFVNGVKRQKSGFELKCGDKVEFEVPAPVFGTITKLKRFGTSVFTP